MLERRVLYLALIFCPALVGLFVLSSPGNHSANASVAAFCATATPGTVTPFDAHLQATACPTPTATTGSQPTNTPAATPSATNTPAAPSVPTNTPIATNTPAAPSVPTNTPIATATSAPVGAPARIVAQATVQRQGKAALLRWRMAYQLGIKGFRIYAGHRQLTHTLIRPHRSPNYTARVPWIPSARYALVVLYRNGHSLRVPVH